MSLTALQRKIGVEADGIWGVTTLVAAARYYKLNPTRGAHFFGQTAHETGNFTIFTENLNYSATRLREIFGKYFPTDALAKQYERKPDRIANRVYASRMGNGDEASGDGWRYRGRGALQLTGRDNYKAFAEYCNRPDVLTNPDIVATELAFESAMFFFERNKLWSLCDQGVNDSAILAVTRRVNGGTHGLEDRKTKTKSYFSSLTTSTDMQLTEHFSLRELTKSETATRQRIDNTPNAQQIRNLKTLCEKILEPVRNHFDKPVRITSAYRSPALNTAVGGSNTSQHCLGEAVDFEIEGISNPVVAKWVMDNCDFDQVILEFYDPEEGPNSGWVHASYSSVKNRKEVLTAKSVNGKTIYRVGLNV